MGQNLNLIEVAYLYFPPCRVPLELTIEFALNVLFSLRRKYKRCLPVALPTMMSLLLNYSCICWVSGHIQMNGLSWNDWNDQSFWPSILARKRFCTSQDLWHVGVNFNSDHFKRSHALHFHMLSSWISVHSSQCGVPVKRDWVGNIACHFFQIPIYSTN